MNKILYDTLLLRPACPILQAAAGCDPKVASEHFDADTWLIAPTPDMKVYPLSGRDQLIKLVQITEFARSAPA